MLMPGEILSQKVLMPGGAPLPPVNRRKDRNCENIILATCVICICEVIKGPSFAKNKKVFPPHTTVHKKTRRQFENQLHTSCCQAKKCSCPGVGVGSLAKKCSCPGTLVK